MSLIQADLRNIEKLAAEMWQMEFNVDKCKVVHYGKDILDQV